MRRHANSVWMLAIPTVSATTGALLTTSAAQKSSVPKVQDQLAMGEADVR